MATKEDFGEPPAGCNGWSEKSSATMGGGKMTKTTTRIFSFPDGHTEEKTIVTTTDM